MGLRARPSSTPAKIRNSVAAKYQVKSNRVANPTMPMPPTDIAHARSLRAKRRFSAETATLIPLPTSIARSTLSAKAPGIKLKKARRFDAGGFVVPSEERKSIGGMGKGRRG